MRNEEANNVDTQTKLNVMSATGVQIELGSKVLEAAVGESVKKWIAHMEDKLSANRAFLPVLLEQLIVSGLTLENVDKAEKKIRAYIACAELDEPTAEVLQQIIDYQAALGCLLILKRKKGQAVSVMGASRRLKAQTDLNVSKEITVLLEQLTTCKDGLRAKIRETH